MIMRRQTPIPICPMVSLNLPTLTDQFVKDHAIASSPGFLLDNGPISTFNAGILKRHLAGGIGSDPSVSKALGDRAMFLAHVTPFYPKQLAAFPAQLTDLTTPYFLLSNALGASKPCCTSFDSSLMNRKSLVIEDLLVLFLDIQTLGDKSLQKIVISMLEQEDEAKAKRALVTLCALHKDNIWLGDKSERVAIAICEACFHTSPSIMISALGFLLGYENIDDDDNSDAESDDDKETKKISLVVIDRAAVDKKFAERLFSPLQTVKGTGGRVEVILPVFISKI